MQSRTRRTRFFDVSVLVGFVLAVCAAACGAETKGSSAEGPDASSSSQAGGGTTGDGGSSAMGVINYGDAGPFASNGNCLALGSSCATTGDCCSGQCISNVCSFPACVADNAACTANSDCCSLSCVGGQCAALNTTCSTLGNPCSSAAQCCSGYCPAGTCQPSSFCGQSGDSCSGPSDCCNGVCNSSATSVLGTCAATPPGGPANCGLTDGMLCSGNAADGGVTFVDGGLPQCGGGCCSRACAPWGPTGVLVCQPASGCHVVGDLCTRDSDCCGSTGLPGGSTKPVTCDITAPATVGVCRLPMGCKPDGDVCKLATMSCNSSCDCCSGNCENEPTCIQDNVGVPRCAGACVGTGQACASSANCCNGVPCVPNTTPAADGGAAPPYVCYGAQCVPNCGACTNTADCCPGSSCMTAPGSTLGTCGPCGSNGGQPDAGNGGMADAGGAPMGDGGGAGGGGACSQFGQLCPNGTVCCDGIPCIAGRCGVVSVPR